MTSSPESQMQMPPVCLLAIVICVSCGAPASEPESAPWEPNDVPLCDPCPSLDEEDPSWEVPPQVYVSPNHLAFYGELSAEIPAQTVRVINKEPLRVFVIRAAIVDAGTVFSGEGDADYLAVKTPELSEPLGYGDELELTVWFYTSTKQRNAVLLVDTTHTDFATLKVELSGKCFNDGSG